MLHPTPGGDYAPTARWSGLTKMQRVMLDAISGPEGHGEYNIWIGGSHFQGYGGHPGRGPQGTDAGRYQFTKTTWGPVARALGLHDFSPESQDKGALAYARQIYGKNLDRDLESGHFNPARLKDVWVSIRNMGVSNWIKRNWEPALKASQGGQSPAATPQLKTVMTTSEINAWNAAQGGPQPVGGDVSPGFTKPPGLYGSPQVQSLLRQYGMGGNISSKYKSATGFENAPITAALTEAGGWSEKANAVMAALKLDTHLAVHGLTQDWRDIVSAGHKLKNSIKKGLGGPAVRASEALKNTPLSDHAGHAFAADHLKSAPLGSGHTHLMNHSNVHAPTMNSTINIHGVNDSEAIGRETSFHQKRLWSGITRNTTTPAS